MTHTAAAHIAAAPRSPEEVEHIVIMERLHRHNHGRLCGARALRRHLRQIGLHPLPSVLRIGQILAQYGLTHGRTGWYEGEQPDRLPASAHVPPSERKHFSVIENGPIK
jgi:hypothetical protein